MTTSMTERDETTGTSPQHYHHTRTVEIAGRTVRAHVERGHYLTTTSRAVAEVLNDQMTWTMLAAEATSEWWYNTPAPGPDIDDPARFLGPVTERLLQRAATILAAPPTTHTLSPHLHGAISALLATSYGYDAEHRIEPDDITWAYTHGGALHIIEHPDGSVTFTKHHREDCLFNTSRGAQECDDDCYFTHPADAEREARR
ncbi:hypothetical protein BBK82_07705 [Lentzea guizhouensis]|uniref:Uncharacterized protein n=1 Tax=Lentzea guizhouensis TaxID=1586287 RepID=A0A1B2HE23_9PSEU|nr:hypothetical protein [Lentzea guizhouensis]ANZ35977.1 hypothetical protein BBK82_07705 [Lentzea guizhouensis]